MVIAVVVVIVIAVKVVKPVTIVFAEGVGVLAENAVTLATDKVLCPVVCPAVPTLVAMETLCSLSMTTWVQWWLWNRILTGQLHLLIDCWPIDFSLYSIDWEDMTLMGVFDMTDSLLIPPDHPSRKRGDNYYLNRWVMDSWNVWRQTERNKAGRKEMWETRRKEGEDKERKGREGRKEQVCLSSNCDFPSA